MQSADTSEPPANSDPVANLHEGDKLAACYLLQRRVEGTGNRVVWIAHDEVLGKDVSLHFLPNAMLDDEQALDVLRHEVKRNRMLIHPGILRVFDLVEDDGWSAVSMDAFTGGTLAARQAGAPQGIFEPAEIKSWLETICQTLDDAHRIKLAHGDVTPENVLIEKNGSVLLTNFGMSICIKHALGEHDGAESAHQSAQQLEGNAPTSADDLFAVGVLMHRLLAGAAPHSGPDDRETAPGIAEHRAKLEKTGSPIPPEWEKLVASCLERSPGARPKSMAEIVQQLAGHRVPLNVVSEPTNTEEPTGPVMAKVEKTADAEEPPADAAKPDEEKPSNVVEAPPRGKKEPAIEKIATEKRRAPVGKAEPKLPAESPRNPFAKRGVQNEDMPRDGGRSQWKLVGVGAVVLAVMVWAVIYFAGDGRGQKASRERGNAATILETKSEPPATSVTPGTADTKAVDPEQASVTEPAQPDPATEKSASPEASSETAGIDAARKALEAAEKTVQDAQQRKQEAETALGEAKAKVEEKAKSLTPLQRDSDEMIAPQKTRGAAQAAEQAKQTAADKARLAEESRKSLALADETLKSLKAMAAEPATAFAPIKKAADEMTAIRKKREDDAKTAEVAAKKAQQLADEKAALAERASKGAEGNAESKGRIAAKEKAEGELKELQKEVEEKQRAVEEATKALAEATARRDRQGPAVRSDMPIKAETGEANATVNPSGVEANIAENEPPKEKTEAPPKEALAGPGFVNSLGMKFVPVGDVLFSIWQTRVKDLEAFAKGSPSFKSTAWRDPGFKQGPEHPVVQVTWDEARLFCKWLTTLERTERLIGPNQEYRLPTDREWSMAVGLGEESGSTPQARDIGVLDVYPWGKQWPPPAGVGNYTGEETESDVAIKGYNDKFPWTSPVGSFPPNKYGIYDMGGNVWQWVMDNWNEESRTKVLRGASWYNGAVSLSLLSSCRVHAAPDSSTDNYGFRVIIANAGSDSGGKASRK